MTRWVPCRVWARAVSCAPLPRPQLSSAALLERWRHVPAIDAAALRSDLDTLLDADA